MTPEELDAHAKQVADSLPPLSTEQRDTIRAAFGGFEAHVARAVADAPPLSVAQRDRIAMILNQRAAVGAEALADAASFDDDFSALSEVANHAHN